MYLNFILKVMHFFLIVTQYQAQFNIWTIAETLNQ